MPGSAIPSEGNGVDFSPVRALTRTVYRPVDPTAFDWIKLVFIRDGSAILLSEFGERPVRLGDAVLLSANVLCGIEPEGHVTATVIYADPDYVVDQVFWQHVGMLRDRFDARDLAATVYTEPAQILRLGECHVGMTMPWLDELVALSVQKQPVTNFYRMQALWFAIAHVIAPFVKTSTTRMSSTQRATTWPATPRIRALGPLRDEARRIAELLRAEPSRRWSVTQLASDVHLSKSQVGRVFVEAFGKSPIAYLTMLRVERMAGLLRSTDAPIAVIAREVGWGDADFAARQFRRSVGLTPSKYRAIRRQQEADPSG